jgi:NTP pyrophosphatase (non-canonical NTP hydrolase)
MDVKLPNGFNELCKLHSYNMQQKGFHDDITFIQELDEADPMAEVMYTNALSTKLALIMSECGEAIEALRKGKYGYEQKDTFEDEIADVMLRLIDFIGMCKIDIERQVHWKSKLNAKRPHKHGKLF